jgi:hypothetical protein
MAFQDFFIFAHAHLASGSDRLRRRCRGVQLFLVFDVGIMKIAWAAIKKLFMCSAGSRSAHPARQLTILPFYILVPDTHRWGSGTFPPFCAKHLP